MSRIYTEDEYRIFLENEYARWKEDISSLMVIIMPALKEMEDAINQVIGQVIKKEGKP